MTNSFFQKTVAHIVREDYRTADIFKKYGINYCCGGQLLLEEACLQKQLDYEKIIRELEQATRIMHLSNNLQYNKWETGFLIDYIINVHHAYLKDTLPGFGISLASFVSGHKKQYPYLEEMQSLVETISSLLLANNQQEEEIIFPYIKQIENTHRRKEIYGNLFVRTLRKPLSHIENEHKKISDLLTQIRTLTNNYKIPDNACINHQVIFQKLQEIDNDLIQHKHLENNILFPRAIEMEHELLQL